MFDTQHSKRSENDRSSAESAQEPSRTKRNIHHPGDLSRIPLYTQLAWGNQPPPGLRLSMQRKEPYEGEAVQEENEATQHKENTTGLPDTLKAGIENLSGLSMDDVQVHYHSSKPIEMQALAYTQGTEIHVGTGQEQHLAHEAWHVVQQAQGRVKPTMHMKGDVPVNDDIGLETEADVMGAKAAQTTQKQNLKIETSIATERKLTGFNTTLGTYPAQLLGIKLGGKILSTYDNAMQNQEFKGAIEGLYKKGYEERRVKYHAKQLFSAEYTFSDIERFMTELQYDLETKSMEDEPLTLQERYMTKYGWERAAKDQKKADLSNRLRELKLYRTMSREDGQEIVKGNYTVLAQSHLGDFKQALRYFNGLSSDSKVLIEFKLKQGAERSLFSRSLALPKAEDRSSQLKNMADAMGGKKVDFPVANSNEGLSKENIGIKSEASGEAGFSIAISNISVAE